MRCASGAPRQTETINEAASASANIHKVTFGVSLATLHFAVDHTGTLSGSFLVYRDDDDNGKVGFFRLILFLNNGGSNTVTALLSACS